MKKSYFWGLLLAILALIPSQNAFADYCTFSGNSTHTERRLQSFTLTDGVTDAAVQDVQPALRSAVYKDMTSVVFETSPGATISFKALDWKGSWMHGYAYIDYDNDQVFNQDNELVSYSFYSPTDAGTGTNSKGETVGNGAGITTSSMPNWVIPTDLAAGDYRFRFKGDWNSKDPCGITGSTNNTAANGGFMVDITIRVVAAIPERTITVDVVPAEGGSVTGAGTAAGNITLTATPNPGYEFVNWTLNGEEVGTDVVFTDAAEGDKTYVANFAALTAYPEMSYMYSNGMDQANRYLKEVVATAGETVTTVFSAATTSELPKIDPDVTGMATTVGAYVDKTATPIIVPQGTTEFTVNFKAWTESMTIGSSSASCQLNWTQQAVFVDWNNNFYFYDEGENYGKNSDNMPNPELIVADGYTRTFSVPEGVQPGVYRMRVCYFEPNGNNAQQWQNTIFEKGNCTTRNGKTYDFAIEVIEVTPETPVYAVSVATADEAMGTAEVSATEVEEGTEVMFTATAAEGYQFVNWTSGEEVVSTENPYTVAVTAEMALTANFELIPVTKYAVSAATADEAMGTAEVSATEVEEGTEVMFTATAAEGYQFVNWTSGEEVVSTENPYTVAVTAEMALTANFELIPVTKYTVTVNAGVGGTAEASATEVEEGQTVTLTATAAEGYVFANWTSSAVAPVYYIQNYNTKKYLGYNTVNLAAIDEQTSDVTFTPSTMSEGDFTIFLTNATYNQETPAKQNSYMHCGSNGRFSGNSVNTSASQQIAIFKVEDPTAETITATKVSEITAGATYMFVGLKSGVYYALTDELYEANHATDQRMVGAEVTITDGTLTFVPGTSSALWTIVNKAVASTENPYTVTVTADVEYTANFVEVEAPVLVPTIVLTVDKVDQEWQFNINANADDSKEIKVDWGNGALVDYTIENYNTSSVYPYHTTITGTPVGEGVVKIYAGEGNLYKFDCSYAESYGVKVTSLDLSGVNYLKELNVASNSLTTLDVSQVTGMNKVVCQGNPITSLVINTSLTRIEANDCALTSIDFTGATAITYLAVNNNPMNTLDLSALTALKTLYANNTGLTTLDISLNTKLRDLYLNDNQLTTLNVSNVVSGAYVYAKDNNLTEIVGLEALTAGSKLHITGNNFTLATLPAATILTTEGESGKYCYAPQTAMTIATEINEGEELDLSAQTNIVGRAAEAKATVYTWYTAEGEEFTSYTEESGKFTFYVDADTELYCAMTTEAFPSFSGVNAFKTTNIIVKYVQGVEPPAPVYAVSVATADETMGTAEVSATEAEEGTEVTFAATANLGYKFTSWTAGEEVVSTENPYTVAVTAEMALTANFEALTPAIIVTNDTTGVERQFTFDAFVEGAKVQIDWGNGDLEEYDIAYYDSWTTWTTTITGTLKGEGIVKIYGDQIRSFDCSYAASYPVKVTSLDLTGCPNLYELVCNSNQLTALDLSANTALVKLTANNSAFAGGVDLSANTALTTIDFNAAGLTTIDLSANTALTSVKLNDNQLDGLDLSANTALTTLYANNTGLTSIDLSANTSLNALYLNNNQLTTLDVSKMSKGTATRIYIYAKNNNLTEFVTSEQVLLSSTRIYIDGNAFTLATLPAISGINAYVYAPQQAMTIATEITEGEELDLSSQAMVGENATVYTWYTTEGEEFTGYTVEGGKFVFDVDADTELYCTMTNASFDKFSGSNAFATTNILVKYVAPTTYTVTVTTFDGGTVAIQGYEGETAQIEEGTQVTVVATPAEGFEFVSWTDADDAWDTDLTFNAEYTFTVTRDINLKAWFSQLPVITTCQVLVEVAPTEDYGTVVIEGVEGLLAEVEVGTEVTAVATPAEGKIFEGWFTFEGDELSTDATYTFTATEDIVVVAWFTDAPVVEPEYCTDFGTSTRNGGGRSLTSVALSDGVNGGTVSVNQSSSYGAAIYVDKTDVEISLEAGKEITADVNFAGEWMNSYLFVDWNNDGEFTANLNNFIPAEDSELLSFSFWTGENGSPSTNGVSDSYGYNSLGQSVSENARSNWDLPVFTIPANIAEGTYRARVKIDWNNANPCGITSTSDAPCVVDFMLTITAPDGIEDADADAVQVYAADGVIYINGYEGDVKVVNAAGQVIKDVNVNGNDTLEVAAGLYIVVTGDQVTKVVVK